MSTYFEFNAGCAQLVPPELLDLDMAVMQPIEVVHIPMDNALFDLVDKSIGARTYGQTEITADTAWLRDAARKRRR